MKPWAAFSLLALLAGCAQTPRPQEITKIVLSLQQCKFGCTSVQYAFYADGRLEYGNAARYTARTRISLRTYRGIADLLVRTPAFSGHRYAIADGMPSTAIWTEFSGRHAQIVFPTEQFGASTDSGVRALNRWAQMASMYARAAVARRRNALVMRLRRLDTLRRVVFDSGGCFGRCPSYTATFSSGGGASLRNARFFLGGTPQVAVNASGRVPWARVEDALAASGFADLQPEYPLHVVDVYGAWFEFDYAGGFSYTVRAPDRTQWPPELAQLVGEFQQLVRDTDWKPATEHTPSAASSPLEDPAYRRRFRT